MRKREGQVGEQKPVRDRQAKSDESMRVENVAHKNFGDAFRCLGLMDVTIFVNEVVSILPLIAQHV